jgi:hypothetical protein
VDKGNIGMAALIGASVLSLSIAIADDMTQGAGQTCEFWIIVAVATILQPMALAIVVMMVAGPEIRSVVKFRISGDRRRRDEVGDGDSDVGPGPAGYDSGGDSGDW